MDPHTLAKLSSEDLTALFCERLKERDAPGAEGAFLEIECRFRSQSTTIDGSRQFVDEFLPLIGKREVRSLHLSDPLARLVARLEYLLEIAGERSRAVNEEILMRRVVASRARGADLIKELASVDGLTAGELARRLHISRSNLSPLLSTFHGQGIIDRTQAGKNAFISLTPKARALFAAPASERTRAEPPYRTGGPITYVRFAGVEEVA